jgi:type III secretory pathway component EscT
MASNVLGGLPLSGELQALVLGWFLWAPTALMVPAVSWIGAPVTSRLAVGLGLSVCVAPVIGRAPEGSFWFELIEFLLMGFAVAVGSGAVIWAAMMAGGVADRLGPGGAQRGASAEAEPLPTGPFGMLFGMLSILAFLGAGGPAHVGAALGRLMVVPQTGLLGAIIDGCLASITLAVTVATPILLAATLLELITALLQRAAYPVAVEGILPGLKGLAFVFFIALAVGLMLSMLSEALPSVASERP